MGKWGHSRQELAWPDWTATQEVSLCAHSIRSLLVALSHGPFPHFLLCDPPSTCGVLPMEAVGSPLAYLAIGRDANRKDRVKTPPNSICLSVSVTLFLSLCL
jgi:hypothetical protein